MNNTIPEMADLRGKYWEQPNRDDILIDDESALMNKESFKKLKEYSTSIPSGKYPGKMWKSNCGKELGYLVWFSVSEDPKFLDINHRNIIIVEE